MRRITWYRIFLTVLTLLVFYAVPEGLLKNIGLVALVILIWLTPNGN